MSQRQWASNVHPKNSTNISSRLRAIDEASELLAAFARRHRLVTAAQWLVVTPAESSNVLDVTPLRRQRYKSIVQFHCNSRSAAKRAPRHSAAVIHAFDDLVQETAIVASQENHAGYQFNPINRTIF